MFRRSRFSVRPNVGTAGRAAAPPEARSGNLDASETPKEAGESSAAAAVTDTSIVTPSEKPTATGDGNDQNGEGTNSSAAVQRRKRFSIKPKVAPGRPSTLLRTPKSPVKAVVQTPVEVSGSGLEKQSTSGQTKTTAAPVRLQSPRRRRSSEESRQTRAPPKATVIPSDSTGPSAVPAADSPEQTHPSAENSKQAENQTGSPDKEIPSKLSDEAPHSLPDKEAMEISEKAKTLVSSKSLRSLTPPTSSLSRLLNDPADLQRIAKAQKLRELLRVEMHKEKKIKKAKFLSKEYSLDPAKMTMRDLIRYLPESNPMSSTSVGEEGPENEFVVPPSPGREESPETAQEPKLPLKTTRGSEVGEEVAAEEEELDEEALMVPQVKVAEDGSLIIDEESLTVEVQRAKGPNPAQDRDPIFERGSTTTYSSFRKGTYTKPWSEEETDMFFLAISMVGTDFSMICQLFPHRARSEIKNKFKKEERANSWRVDKAFRDRRKLDIEYFSKLLEKIMEFQQNKKKLRKLVKNSPKTPKKRTKGKRSARNLSDVEEEDEDEDEVIDLEEEEEREKENEELCTEGGRPASKSKKNRKRKNRQDASSEEPSDKKNKSLERSSEQDEVSVPEDAEAALPEDHTNADTPEETEKNVSAAKDATIKPAKLARGRAPKPLLTLGRKWGKKSTPTPNVAKDTGDESENKDTSPQPQANKGTSADDNNDEEDVSSEEEDTTVQPPKPTRYGRVPKPTKPLNYPAKEEAPSPSASETAAASPTGSTASAAKPKPRCTAKRVRSSKSQSAQESKKPKLVTLRASQSEDSDDESQWEVEEVVHPGFSLSKDSAAPAFVPVGLCSPPPVISEVEETMEELDILANMPDVLGISQDALCPDASCELAQNETGTAEPCEHQLDLLVDVIDFLSSDQPEVSEDQSYNEAAQTLLTIGNMTHLSQSQPAETATQDQSTGEMSISAGESIQPHLDVESASNQENCVASVTSEAHEETPEADVLVELEHSASGSDHVPITESMEQTTGSHLHADSSQEPQSSPEGSKKHPPAFRRGLSSRVKPKPNLGQASRGARSKSQPEPSVARVVEDTASPDRSQTSSMAAESHADCSATPSKDDAPCTAAKLPEQPACQEWSADNVKPHAAPTHQQDLEQSTIDSSTGSGGESSQETSCPSVETSVTPVAESQSDDTTSRETRKSRFPKVKPKPNLAHASRTIRLKSQPTKEPAEEESILTASTDQVEVEPKCTSSPSSSPEKPGQSTSPASDLIPSLDTTLPTEELSANIETKTDDGAVGQVDQSPSVCQDPYEPCREEMTQATRATSESTEQTLSPHPDSAESGRSDLPTSEPAASQSQAGPAGSEELSSSNEVLKRDSQSDSSGLNLPQRRRRLANLKPRLGVSSRTTQAQPKSDDVSKPTEAAETPSVRPAPAAPSAQPEPDPPSDNTQPLPLESQSEPQAGQQSAENTVPNQPVCQSTDERESSTSESCSKTPQVRRSRLVKPKPNLARTREAPRKPVQSRSPAEAGAGAGASSSPSTDPHPSSEAVDPPACPVQPVAEVGHDLQKPVEGAIEQPTEQSFPPDAVCMTKVIEELSQHSFPQNNAAISADCTTPLPGSDIQHASTSSAGETQSHPSLALFPDMLSMQEPPDPEETFYILSLTEISGCDPSVSEPVSYLPVTEASMQQQSDPGGALAAVDDGLLSNVTLPVPTEECAETSLSSGMETVPDPAPCIGSVVERPLDPNEGASVQPSLVEEAIQIEDHADCPSAPQNQAAAQRQVKPRVSRKKQARQAPAVKDEEAASQHTVTESEGAQATQSRRASTRSKKARDLPSVTSSETGSDATPSPVSRAKQGPKVRAPGRAPAASASHQVSGSATSPTQTAAGREQSPEEHLQPGRDPAPSTSLRPAEVSASPPSDAEDQDEPTSVSEYFLSDIFTEVEED